MKFEVRVLNKRSLYCIAMAVAVFGLLAACIAVFYHGVWGRGVVLSCCIFASLAIAWLGWHLLKLGDAIACIANCLNNSRLPDIDADKGTIVGRLSEAINKFYSDRANCIDGFKKQVKELKIEVQLARRQKSNIEAVIHGISDAVLVVDEFDRMVMANEAGGRLFGFDHNNCRHKLVAELIDSEKSEVIDFLRQSRQSKQRATRRQIEICDSLSLKTFDCIVSCSYDDSERVCGVVAALHDITREKEISQMKNDFVGAVCHDLKTPLAAISACSEMLVDDEAEDEQAKEDFCSLIQSQAERLNRMIDDLLSASRIESGLIKVEAEPVSLTILIEEQMRMIKGYAEEKNIRITGQRPIVFDQVYADKDMISRVIINLLSNAVKYTPNGGSVEIATEVDEFAGIARVSVTDSGIGISKEDIGRVFDKFYRVKGGETKAKGTGLGLNLVKQIVEDVHNGRMFVKSEVDVGSTFGFELPLATVGAVLNSV